MSDSLLQMRNISKRFGPTIALENVSLSARAGHVLALVGENGAGKSTLMKVLSGAHRPDAGEMTLSGQPYRPATPQEARTAGVAMIYQELNLAPDLSVEDNIMLGQERSRFGFLSRRRQRPLVREALDLLGHRELRPETLVGELSIGAKQLVEIARALVQQAKLIVFDEPTSSLTREDVQTLFRVIRTLKQRGIGMIYISHFLEEIREVCDAYAILRDGNTVGEGTLENVTDEQVVALMVGREVDDLFPDVPHTPGKTLLDVKSLSGTTFPVDVTMSIRRGEIFGLAGLVGAGRTELVRSLYALDEVRTGSVTIAEAQPKRTPRARIDAGMGVVSEDRKTEGLAQSLSIADNLTLSKLGRYAKLGWINRGRRSRSAAEWMTRLEVKARHPGQTISELSGGNQQKVAIARVLHEGADLLLLDEPTRGIDVGTKAEIYRLIGEAAAEGKAVLFVSSYLTELLAVCDTIGVMARGRLREVRPTADWTEESIMQVAVHSDSVAPVS